MSSGYEDWGAGTDKAKTAKIERSLAQDQGREIKKEVVGALYPSKIVNGVDIGDICNFWAYKVMTNLSTDDTKLIDRLYTMIYLAYQSGRNLNEWKPFQITMTRGGFRAISEKIGEFKSIPKLSFMGHLEKPKKKSSGYGNVRW